MSGGAGAAAGDDDVEVARPRPHRFSLRLLSAVLVAGVVVAVTANVLVGATIEREGRRAALRALQGELRALSADARRQADGERAQFDLSTLVRELSMRPDVLSMHIANAEGQALAVAGRMDRRSLERGAAALRAGRPPQALLRETPDRHIELIAPVGDRYALVVDRSTAALDEQVAGVRRALLLVQAIGLLVLLVLVWLLGGRRLARAHKEALERATLDGLTDLANHRAFQDELLRAAATAERGAGEAGLLLLDLDGFKRLNDVHGHGAGDALLRRVAEALTTAGRAEDRAFRIGGDEFALLLPRTTEADALGVARRLQLYLQRIGALASIGVGATRPGMRDGLQLREEADAALYEAKRRRRHEALPYSATSDDVVARHPRKVEAMWRLIEDETLVDVAFQPIWDLDADRVIGVEALARPSVHLGLDGPAEAFEVAERTGAAARLDRTCVRRALAAASDLPAEVLLFLNLSADTLVGEGEPGAAWVADEVAAVGMDPGRVVIEVSERFGGRPAAVERGAAAVRARGFRLALDDIGAGEAGMARLRELDVDFLKLDRSVVLGAATEPGARAVLAAVAAFAAATGAFVIAEGIEDEAALETVRRAAAPPLGGRPPSIRGGQGFGLTRPQPSLAAALSARSAIGLHSSG